MTESLMAYSVWLSRLQSGWLENWEYFAGRSGDISTCHCIYTGLEASPTSFAVCTSGTFLQGNAARGWRLLLSWI